MKKILMMLLLVASTANVVAQSPKVVFSDKDGWHKIGETTVDFKKETDRILIVGANKFAALQIKVIDAPISLVSFDIYFENGKKKNVKVGKEFKAKGETAIVDLSGEKVVKQVDFFYQTVGTNTNQKAHVELWGFKTNPNKK